MFLTALKDNFTHFSGLRCRGSHSSSSKALNLFPHVGILSVFGRFGAGSDADPFGFSLSGISIKAPYFSL